MMISIVVLIVLLSWMMGSILYGLVVLSKKSEHYKLTEIEKLIVLPYTLCEYHVDWFLSKFEGK